jgi:outer membrane protein assembly factor BamB
MYKDFHLSIIRSLVTAAFFIFAGQSVAQDAIAPSIWPQFRGPDFNPILENEKLPDRWSTTENIEWSIDIDGRGWSSPIVVDGKVFLTSVKTEGESKAPQSGTDYSNEYVAELMKQGLSEEEVERKIMERDFELPDQVSLHYYLLCIDLKSGSEIWKQKYHFGKPPGGRHRKNSFASETPVTDGKFIYVYATHLGLFAYDFSGNQVWHSELEKHPIYMEFGSGTSPVLLDDKLIIVDDNQEHSSISAYNTADGKLVWQTDRKVPDGFPAQMPKSGWATPYVWKNELRTEIVTISPGVAISYDINGNELWRLNGMTPAPSSSSFAYDGLLYLDAGKMKPIFAIRPGATGDITPKEGEESTEFIAWIRPRMGTYIPTPVAYQGALYIVQDKGIAIRLDAKTGEETFKARISSKGGADFTSSPWAYNGKVFCISEQGNTYVFEAAEEYKLLHVNPLDDFVMATPAIVEDRLLYPPPTRLYCIRNES